MNIYDPANDIVYVHLAQQPHPQTGVSFLATAGRASDVVAELGADGKVHGSTTSSDSEQQITARLAG